MIMYMCACVCVCVCIQGFKDSRIQGLYSAHLHGNLHGRFATYKTHRIHELKFTHALKTYSR